MVILDGDDLRSGINEDLDFTDEDRTENIRRGAELAALLCRQGFFVVAAFVTPFEEQRQLVRRILKNYAVTLHWIKHSSNRSEFTALPLWPMRFDEPQD